MRLRYEILLIVCCVSLIILLKVIISAHVELYKGDRASKNRELFKAVKHYSRAIEWYYPFSRVIPTSIANIWKIVETLEKEGKIDTAYDAISSMKGSLSAIRGISNPYAEWIKQCDIRLDKLNPLSKREPGIKIDINKISNDPDRLWSAIMLVGFLGWILGVILCIHYMYSKEKSRKRVLLTGGLAFLSYLIWLIGLYYA